MTDKVAELLRSAIGGKRPEDFVLTCDTGKPVHDLRAAWWQLCVRAELGEFVCRSCGKPWAEKKCECGCRKRKYRGLFAHDLRRSAAKALRAAGVSESVIMAAGGWKTAAMFRRYAIVSSADQRSAVQMLERSRAAHTERGTNPQTNPLEQKSPVATGSKSEVKVQ